MKVLFLEAAEQELIEAEAYYNGQREGLGFEFSEEVRATINRIIEYPDAWSPISRRTRRCRTRRFPYGVIYQVREEVLLIVAVMHLQREPESWRKRVPKRLR